jgi:hypothetical protein
LKTWLTHDPVRLNRIFFICLILLLPLSSGFARQQESKLVCSAVQSQIEAKPGTIAAASIKVTNLTSEQQTYDATIDLPAGWKPVIREFPFEIKAGDTDVRLITFSIPSDAPAHRYKIRYSVRDHASPANEAVASVEVIVVRVVQLDLKLLQAPRFVIAGTTFTTAVLVTNQGNSAGSVQLSYRSSYDFLVRLDSTMINLAPKETRQVQFYVTSDEKSGKVNHILEVEAKSRQDTTIRVKISSGVEIIPRTTKLEEEYLVYPVSLRLREVGQDGKFATQAEVYGFGSLNEKKTDRLEFLFRAPETQTISTLGQRDEYRISYRRDNLELYAGDQNYSLSTLTETGRYATGIGGKADIGRLSAGGFYNTTRWTTSSQKETGGFLNYNVIKSATLGVNYLSKREQFSSDIMSVRGLFKPYTGSTLDLEYGTGVKDNKHDNAYAALLAGNQRWIAYDLRFVHAGPDFGGYYRDIDFFSSSINLQPIRNVRVETYMRLENRNLARDTNQISVPHDASYQIGAGYSDYISIYYRNNSLQDQSDSSKYRTREEAIQTRVGYNFSFANIYANMDFGTTRDELQIKKSPFKRLALSASFNLFAKQNYSTSFEYTTSRDIYTGEEQERLSANLNAWILFGESTQAQLNMYGSRVNASIEQTYSMFEASIEHVFPFNHKLILHGRLNVITPSTKNSEIAYTLEYEIPIGVPIKRITAVGQLRGSIQDEQGRGIANVLINIGENAALSDRRGAFSFASLKPGSVFLTVDKASIGFDRITTQPMPMEVLIRGGEETKLMLRVTRSVAIAGNILLFSAKEQGFLDTSTALTEMGGKSGVFLELSNSTEIHRRVSDNKGRFLFADLRPGQWILKVIGGDIPEYYNIYPESMRIELSPGERKDVTIQLRPRKRTIKMLQEGPLTQETPPAIEKKDTLSSILQTPRPCMVTYNEKRKGYVLQISSWLTRTKANRVAKRTDTIVGLKTFKEAADVPSLGRRYRVFIGVFKTREEAVVFCRQFDFEL